MIYTHVMNKPGVAVISPADRRGKPPAGPSEPGVGGRDGIRIRRKPS
jgi:hypothetical protein